MAKNIATAFILFAIVLISSCSGGPPKHSPGGPYYFKGWAHYFYPFIPTHEITVDEAKQLEQQHYGYYIAFFNEDGRIKSFEAKYEGKTKFKTDYSYSNGLITKEETVANGKKSVIYYDNKGNRP